MKCKKLSAMLLRLIKYLLSTVLFLLACLSFVALFLYHFKDFLTLDALRYFAPLLALFLVLFLIWAIAKDN